MIRKLLHALAVVAVVLVASLVAAQPAQAAPTGLCTTAEWRNPTSFADCARRAKEAIGNEVGCVTAPTPGSPSSGAVGLFSVRPESSLRSGVSGYYSMYGAGGYGLDTYDMGCLDKLKHPDVVFENTIASKAFGVAAGVLAAANGLREWAYNPAGAWSWLDGLLLVPATDVIYRYVFNIFGALTLAAVGIFLLVIAHRGQMSHAMRVAAWAVLVLVAVTAVAKWPVAAANGADKVAGTGLATMHSILGPAPQDVPADKCVLGAAACKDDRSASARASDVATEAILYRLWLRAMLGSADSATAQKYGPALYDATALTWDEAAAVETNPATRQATLDQKASTFNSVASQIQAEDPQAYEHLQGLHGSDRAGAGFFAVLFSVAFAAFDMTASVVILFGFLIFRIAIILLPLLATVGLHLHASSGVRRIFHTVVAAVFNIVVFGAGAGLYLMAVDLILRGPLVPAFQMVVIALTGVLLGVALHPLRHLWHTATGRSRADDGLLTRLVKGGKSVYADHRAAAPDTAAAKDGTAGSDSTSTRPEAAPTRPRRSPVRTMGAAVAPSVATAAGHPVVSAVVGAAAEKPTGGGQRPEAKGSKVAAVKRIVAAAVPAVATVAGGPAAGAAASAATAKAAAPAARPRPETR